MAKSKRKYAVKKTQQKQDLSYREMLEIVYMDQKEMQLAYEQNAILLQKMNEDIRRNMEQYIKLQNEVIKRKLQYHSSEIENQSIDDMREKYKNILEMHENENS
jgi:hypothetical protein